MQMMRATCTQCNWTFDVASLPGSVSDATKAMLARSLCPICYSKGAVMASPRPLTPDEIAAKTMGKLGSAVGETNNEDTANQGAKAMSTAIEDIAAERLRQVEAEGWDLEHDDRHREGQMALAAATYAIESADRSRQCIFVALGTAPLQAKSNAGYVSFFGLLWPWASKFWKPTNPRRNLVKAGALIVAEIERLDRAAERAAAKPPAPSDS